MRKLCLSSLVLYSPFVFLACIQIETKSQDCCGSGMASVSAPALPDSAIPDVPQTQSRVVVAPVTDTACPLHPPVTNVQKQENSAWCWAASTTQVIRHLEPNLNLTQCMTVQKTLTPEVEEYIRQEEAKGRTDVRVDCCLVTDEEMKNYDPRNPNPRPNDKYIPDSVEVCHSRGRPEWALNALGYENQFGLVKWDPDVLQGQGLTWDQLVGQICDNRPFISVKAWVEGGTHTEVITGYHYNGPDAWVDVVSHGMDTFFSEPFDDYQGKPGDYVHVRDYYDIGR